MTLGRLAAAVGLALMAALGSAGPASACSMVFPPIDEVLAEADLIFEGEVTAVDGGRLTLDVTEVYRGDVSRGTVDLGSSEATACAVRAEPGQTIIVATDALDKLSLAGVWWVLDDGTLGTLAPEPPTTTADDFRRLLGGLPDTAMLVNTTPTSTVGFVILLTAAGLAAVSAGLLWRHGRRARSAGAPRSDAT